MRVLLLACLPLALSILLGACRSTEDCDLPPTRPTNVVLILADDLGPEGLGSFGGTLTPSPHLDRLAAGGLRFTDAHTTPLCTPTRVRLMTGRAGPRSYTGFRTLDPSERTFAHLLDRKSVV